MKLLLYLILTLALVSPSVWAQFDSLAYERPPRVDAANILPGNMRQSGHHRLSNDVGMVGNFYRFTVDSDFGAYHVTSLALLKIRIHEIRTLSQAVTRFQRENAPVFNSLPSQLRVTGDSVRDIVTSPISTSSQLAGQFTNKLGRTLRGEVLTPDARGDEVTPVSAAQKRNMARQLDLDVYSSNSDVQTFLDAVARARTAGRVRSLSPVIKRGSVRVAGGVVDAEIKVRLKNLSEEELSAYNRRLLTDMGIEPATVRSFLAHPAYSPTRRTSISVYLAVLDGVANRGLFVADALAARSEADALAYQNLALMLAYYHEKHARLRELRPGPLFPVALTGKGRLLTALPVDLVYWGRELERGLDNLSRRASMGGYQELELITTGVLTNAARTGARTRGFRLREKFLGG